jgi:rubrerythrin
MDYKPYYHSQQDYGERQMVNDLNSDTLLIDYISRAIVAEAHAYYFYERLAGLAMNEQNRQIILRIQLDEAKHYRWFRQILRRLGGEHPQIPYIELPTEFEEGIRTAIFYELEAATFYQYIASRANSNYIVRHFANAANDEKRHALGLQNMLISIDRPVFNFKSVHSIDNRNEEEYKQYVISWIDEFARVQNENPLIFSIETKYLDNNRQAIQARDKTINGFQYPEDKVPEKYKDMHKELLQTISAYKDAYDTLYLAITTGDSRTVGENVGRLFQLDIVLNRIKNTLNM